MKSAKIETIRAKSPVHARAINKDGRRNAFGDQVVNGILEKRMSDNWDESGRNIPKFTLKGILTRRGLIQDTRILKKRKTPLNIMVLGPGEGAEVLLLNENLKEIKKEIDTLGLTNNLSSEANKIIRNDYSPKKLTALNIFENMNHLSMIGKYDYIYSRAGPLSHTLQPELVILKVASMLKVGGFARFYPLKLNSPTGIKKIIENCQKYLEQKGCKNAIKFKMIANNLIIFREK